MILSPIILFTYNRLEVTQKTVQSLIKNELIKYSDLYIFSDGPRSSEDGKKVNEVRSFLKSIEGFKSITIQESSVNQGLANSVIRGVSSVFKIHNTVIVLEDDLITSPNFLNFMNQALEKFRNNLEIFSVSGYVPDLPSLESLSNDNFFLFRSCSWGWATWKDRWDTVDWEVKDYNSFKFNLIRNIKFAKGGNDLPGMLRDQMNGKINSWAIRWVFHQYKSGKLTVYPKFSKIESIGFGQTATHTKKTKRFVTVLDDGLKKVFYFDTFSGVNPVLAKEFKSVFSIWRRLLDRFY